MNVEDNDMLIRGVDYYHGPLALFKALITVLFCFVEKEMGFN